MNARILFVLILLFFVRSNAQNERAYFNVESFMIEDSLTKNDPVEENLGKYNNFEIHLNNGDVLAINFVTEKFSPLLLLVSPSGEKFVYPGSKEKRVNFTRKIEESGNWNLFVIGGEKDNGEYSCRISFADSSAFAVPSRFGLCDLLQFISSHAKAEFVFLKERQNLLDTFFEKSRIHVSDLVIDENGKLKAIIKSGDSEKLFEKLSGVVYECFEEWNIKEGKRKIKGGNEQTITAIRSGAGTPVLLKISLKNIGSKSKIEIDSFLLK